MQFVMDWRTPAAAFEDVLVCHVILMAQLLPSTSTVLY